MLEILASLIVVCIVVALDEITARTPPDFELWGIPVGKYDGLVWRRIKQAWTNRRGGDGGGQYGV